MRKSETPILNLETPPPAPASRVTARGLLWALPAAIAIIALIPAAIYLQFVLELDAPSWLGPLFRAISDVFTTLFQHGPIVGIALIWLVMFLVAVIHEAGHACAALVLGWPILEFRVLPFSLQKHGGNWKLQMKWRASPSGLVVANPAAVKFHSKVRLYVLAGPVANLATAGLLIPFQFRPEMTILNSLPALIATWSLVTGFLNLLPVNLRGLELDGYVAFVVSRQPKRLAARVSAIKMRQHVVSGKPMETMNQRWVAKAEEVEQASLQSRGGMWLAYAYWLDREELGRAALVLEKLLRSSRNADEKFKGTLFAEAAVLSTLLGKRSEANVWKERAERFVLHDLIYHRCNSYVACANKNFDLALQEAEFASQAADKLPDKNARRRFLRGWNTWITKLEKERAKAEALIP